MSQELESKRAFECSVRELIGERVVAVHYVELDYDTTSEPQWRDDPRFDSLDFGLDLKTASGRTFGFIWGDEFVQYGISIKAHPVEEALSDCHIWDVSTESRWRRLLNQPIRNARVEWWEIEDGEQLTQYPQQVRLDFGVDDFVLISAAELRGQPPPNIYVEHILVIFDEAVARELLLWNAQGEGCVRRV